MSEALGLIPRTAKKTEKEKEKAPRMYFIPQAE
jgi:hypothetical protein